MKWSEFKKIVEDELKGQDPEIAYIDVYGFCGPGEFIVNVDETEGLTVS